MMNVTQTQFWHSNTLSTPPFAKYTICNFPKSSNCDCRYHLTKMSNDSSPFYRERLGKHASLWHRWMTNSTINWNVITNPYPYFNEGWPKLLFRLWHWLVITPHKTKVVHPSKFCQTQHHYIKHCACTLPNTYNLEYHNISACIS